jgi:hypothetical protein
MSIRFVGRAPEGERRRWPVKPAERRHPDCQASPRLFCLCAGGRPQQTRLEVRPCGTTKTLSRAADERLQPRGGKYAPRVSHREDRGRRSHRQDIRQPVRDHEDAHCAELATIPRPGGAPGAARKVVGADADLNERGATLGQAPRLGRKTGRQALPSPRG